MAGDLGEKSEQEEDKLEFTPDAEVLGYISLAQARVLAMTTARETPGGYSRRYRNVPMAFGAVDASEDEDFYNITLSFRPPRGVFGYIWARAVLHRKRGKGRPPPGDEPSQTGTEISGPTYIYRICHSWRDCFSDRCNHHCRHRGRLGLSR